MGFGIFQDLPYVCRDLMRHPVFAMTLLFILGLGIGATTTIYSVVDAVLVRPLPYPEADRLVAIGSTSPGREWREGARGLQRLAGASIANFVDWRERTRSFESLVAVERTSTVLPDPSGGWQVAPSAAAVEGFFDLFSATPVVGRSFTPDDIAGRTGRVAMMSYGAWIRRYGADPVLSKPVRIYPDIPMTIIGVLPPGFQQPEVLGKEEVEFWMPLDPKSSRHARRDRRFSYVFGRLRSGVTVEAARAEIGAVQAAISNEFPDGNVLPDGTRIGAGVNSLYAETVGASGRTLWTFFGASAFLLLLAAINAANLLLVRGIDREREISVRLALGAGRLQLVRSQMTESLLLALFAGCFGVLLAYGGVEAFKRMSPSSLPRIGSVAVNWRILGATTILSLGAGIIVGLFPALRLTQKEIAAAMRRSLGITFVYPGVRLRQVMVIAQLALAVLLCVGAGLLINSYGRLVSINLGFAPHGLTVFSMPMKKRPGSNRQELWEVWDELRRQVESIPGIESVTLASNVPFQSPNWKPPVLLPEDPAEIHRAGISGFVVTPDFFESMGIVLKTGRLFGAQDHPTASKVAIVNDAFVSEHFRGRNAVGSTIRFRDDNGALTDLEIAGVVGNVIQTRVEE